VLSNGRTGVRGKIFEASGVRSGRGNDSGVFHRSGSLKCALYTSNRGTFLTNGDIDTANLLSGVAGFPVGFLVDDGVDRDGSFTSLAVANDELTLSSTHGNHGVDGLNSGLKRLVNTSSGHDAWCLKLQGTTLCALDGTQTINRVSQRVHDPSKISLTHRHRENLTSPGNFLPRLDPAELTQNNNTDFVLVEVLSQTQGAIGELHQLVGHTSWQSLDVGDAIGGIENVTDFRG